MRFVIYGAGAIGGVTGARLHQAGYPVMLIARGDHHEAIARDGLTLEHPDGVERLRIDVARSPDDVGWREDDVVLLAVKSQDTLAAVRALDASVPPHTPVVCVQNGVENERVALRLFANVYGAVVMVPAAHLEPGVVQAYGARLTGIIDVGRYPDGVDHTCTHVVEALANSHFSSTARPDVMRFKYAKLLLNLTNAIEALCEPGPERDALRERARAEGRAVLTAAGIPFEAGDVEDITARWQRYGVREIAGRERAGSSTWQSLARGTGAVEADYLGGEIVLLGRLHAVPTPVNALVGRLVRRLAREGGPPGSTAAADVLAQLG